MDSMKTLHDIERLEAELEALELELHDLWAFVRAYDDWDATSYHWDECKAAREALRQYEEKP
jgi:hypothetical protein